MNKVEMQSSAYACPSVKGAAICTLKALFSTWEAREKKSQKPASKCSQKGRLSPVSACRGGPYRTALTKGSARGNCWLSSLIPFTTHCKARSQMGIKLSLSPTHAVVTRILPLHTLQWLLDSILISCAAQKERGDGAHPAPVYLHSKVHFLLLAKDTPNTCRSGHIPAETGLKSNECY